MCLQPLSLFLSRSNRKGFVLPLCLVTGLVMISLGTVMIARGRDENVKAKTAQNTTVGRGITEAGITQYQQFFQTNRIHSWYSSSRWGELPSEVTQQARPCEPSNSVEADITTKQSMDWQAVDPNDPKKGQYRLLSYDYTYTGGVSGVTEARAPGIGRLVIEGRGAQNLDASNSANSNAVSRSRIEVDIPVQPNALDGGIPGIWLKEGHIGGNRASANVFFNDCSAVSGFTVVGTDPSTNQPYRASATSLQFPTLPPIPDLAGTGRSSQILGRLSGANYTLPRSGDQAVNITRTYSNGETVTLTNFYEYIVDEIDLQAGNNNLTITPGEKVIIYLRGSVKKSDIRHNCTGNATCKATDFQIYGYGDLVTTPPTTQHEICLNGTDLLETFILGPTYTAGVAGGAGGTGGVKGSIWVKNWSNSGGCGSNTSNIVVLQTGNWDEIGLQPQNLPPQILEATNWTQKQVSP